MKSLQMLKRKTALVVALVALSVLSISCNGANEPVTSMEEIERIAAETMQALPTETEVIPTQTPLPTATLIPPTSIPPTNTPPLALTPILPAATRINFAPGATYGTAKGTISPGQTQNFVLGALIGQPLQASVGSFNNDVTMSINSAGGVELLPAEQKSSSWQGSLPATQDYFIQIIAGTSTQDFSLWISIPSRIQFDAGAISATTKGKTVNGNIASYVVAAQGGQTMNVLLSANPDVAALTVWGFSDGQPFIRAVMGSRTFNMQLPSTQDYIINVVPQGGQVVDFTLDVEIK